MSRHQRGIYVSCHLELRHTSACDDVTERVFLRTPGLNPKKYPKAAETNSSQPAFVTFALETIVILNTICQADEATSIVQVVPIGVETAL